MATLPDLSLIPMLLLAASLIAYSLDAEVAQYYFRYGHVDTLGRRPICEEEMAQG